MFPIRDYSLLIRSLINDIRAKKPVAFLFGSAVSYSPDGTGVPNVDGVVSILHNFLIERRMLTESEITEKASEFDDQYQGWFDYLLSVGDQSDVKEVVTRAVLQAWDPQQKTWQIPEALVYFGKLVGNKQLNLQGVLTTNFDPLIQETLLLNGTESTEYFCQSNPHTSQAKTYGPAVPVLHLHGSWTGDTMHTRSQLNADRSAVKSSIKSILNGSKFYIIGYGGWNDIVREALKDIVLDPDAKYEVRWCFFSDDEKTITSENADLFEAVAQGQSISRLQFYKGVNCHTLFREVYEEACKEDGGAFGGTHSTSKKYTEIMPLEQVLSPQRQLTPSEPTSYKIQRDEPHHMVRFLQQIQVADALEADGCVHIECPLGTGRLGFLSSLIDTMEDRNISYFVARVDLSNITTSKQFEEQIVKDVGCDIMTLLLGEKRERVLLLIDNLDASISELIRKCNALVDAAKDFQHGFSVVFLSSNPASLDCKFTCKTVKLAGLSLPDVKEYVKYDNPHLDLNPLVVERIAELTSSLPLKLNVVRKHLTLMSIPELLEDSSQAVAFSTVDESLPSGMLSKLNELSKSEGVDNVRLYSLVQIMSVLSCGQTMQRVRKFYSQKKFQVDDFLRLLELGFIYTVDKPELHIKVIRINPLVRDHILTTSDLNDIKELSVSALSLSAGEFWMLGQVKVCHHESDMMKYQDFAPGNIHTLILSVMAMSINLEDKKLYKATVQASVSYCIYLKRKCLFKELVNFSRNALTHIKDEQDLSFYQANYFLAEGLRMLGLHDESITLLKGLEESFSHQPFRRVALHQEMRATLALACQKTRSKDATTYASRLRLDASKSSNSRFIADSILIELGYSGSDRINRLKRLEKRARNAGHLIVANNISLELATLVPIEGQQHLDKVLRTSETDKYSYYRALLGKVELELAGNASPSEFFDSPLYRRCIDAYSYLFLQRLSNLFNRCHEVLWRASKLTLDFEHLFTLYRTSSLVWRLAGDTGTELKYAQQLSQMPQIEQPINQQARRYIDGRLAYIQKNSAAPTLLS